MNKIKQYILKRLRLSFLKKKDFFGDYADNLAGMKKFFNERDIIVVYIQQDSLKMTLVKPNGVEDQQLLEEVINEQKKEFKRRLRNKHKASLWYVENNYFTRKLGWKAGKENLFLKY